MTLQTWDAHPEAVVDDGKLSVSLAEVGEDSTIRAGALPDAHSLAGGAVSLRLRLANQVVLERRLRRQDATDARTIRPFGYGSALMWVHCYTTQAKALPGKSYRLI